MKARCRIDLKCLKPETLLKGVTGYVKKLN